MIFRLDSLWEGEYKIICFWLSLVLLKKIKEGAMTTNFPLLSCLRKRKGRLIVVMSIDLDKVFYSVKRESLIKGRLHDQTFT